MARDKYSTLDRRVNWLLKHQVFLKDWEPKKIAKAMRADGLIAPTTYWRDCFTGIFRAWEQARKRGRIKC